MKPILTLLVDDEFLALNLLEEFARQAPDLEVVEKVKNPIRALEILQTQPIDLMFLDIQMPTLSGNHLLRTLSHPPLTIFTTAYTDYAVEAFELRAVDYLLKPFSFERFLKAVNLAREQLQLRDQPAAVASATPAPAKDFFSVKVDGKVVKIFFDDILFIEGLKEYVRIVCPDARHVTLESLRHLEETLPPDRFLRVHKSYIVARDKVQSLNGNMLEIGPHKIPISRSKRDEVVARIFY